jgi:hypothetical protein
MKILIAVALGFVFASATHAAPLTAQQQASLDGRKKVIAKWAARPVVVKAVKAINEKGPLPDMTNATWAALRPEDAIVVSFQKSPAGLWLAKKLEDSKGLFSEAFLNGAKGEKVAFASKTTSYIHAGSPKFDVPMTGKTWQGEPEMDASSKVYSVQISTPVLDGDKPIGVLVVGVAVDKLGVKAADE